MAIISLPSIYSNAWSAATAAQASAQNAASSAQSALSVGGSITVTPITVPSASLSDPSDEIAAIGQGANEANALYSTTQATVTAQLQALFASFLAQHFPTDPSFTRAKDWLDTQLASGGAGIRPLIEQRLWERDRDRILAASQQAQEEALTTWAAKRFPVPPGAAIYQNAQIQRDALAKLGDSSRERAVQAFLAELENTRFAVTQAIALHTAGVQAAGDYIRSLALGPQIGVQLATSLADVKSKAAQAAVSYYTAQTSLRDVDSRIAIANAGNALEASKTVYQSNTQLALAKANVAIEAARMTGTMAAAALNTFHGNVGYQESNDLTGTTLI